jgi:ligand-binding SRPBCC domain-containing protein
MRSGTLIDYAVKILGFEHHWRTLITEYDPPDSFVDVQLKGPYKLWHHTHRFVDNHSNTTIIDEIRYIVPFGILGRLMNRIFIRRQLEFIFNYRSQVISRMLGAVDLHRDQSIKKRG